MITFTVIASKFTEREALEKMATLIAMIGGVVDVRIGEPIDVVQAIASRKAMRAVSTILRRNLDNLTNAEIEALVEDEGGTF